MKRMLFGGLLLTIALTGGLLGPAASAGAAPEPDGEIRVQGQAYEGQYDVIRGTLRLRCRAGLAVAELRLSYTQDFTSPESTEAALPTCDGRWQHHAFASFEGFHPGRATVQARMVLVDEATGAPRGEVTASGSIYVRPGARILLPRRVEMVAPGVIELRVLARCDRPWVLPGFSVSASQFEGYAYGSQQLDIPCDGELHARTARLQSSGRQFARGWVRLDASISTLDAVNFDPAVHATATRAARVR